MLPTMIILVRFEPPSDLHSGGADDALLVATLNPATMEVLQLFRGDSVIVRYVSTIPFAIGIEVDCSAG